jgi:hypothetical protein
VVVTTGHADSGAPSFLSRRRSGGGVNSDPRENRDRLAWLLADSSNRGDNSERWASVQNEYAHLTDAELADRLIEIGTEVRQSINNPSRPVKKTVQG